MPEDPTPGGVPRPRSAEVKLALSVGFHFQSRRTQLAWRHLATILVAKFADKEVHRFRDGLDRLQKAAWRRYYLKQGESPTTEDGDWIVVAPEPKEPSLPSAPPSPS